MLEFHNVSKFYGTKQVLKAINLSFNSHHIVGLIGFNGSGKTTTFNIIANIIEDFVGSITIDKLKRDLNFYRRISFLSNSDNLHNTNIVMNQLLFIADLSGTPRREATQIIIKLAKLLRFTEFLNKTVKSLSKGNQQKIKIINLFLNKKTDFYILDEPFDGLDPFMAKVVTKYFLENCKNKCVIIASHRLEIVDDMCDEYFLLREGKIVAHNQKSVNAVTKKVFLTVNLGCEMKTIRCFPFVIKIIDSPKNTIIELQSIACFKKVSQLLVNDPNYQYHYMERQKLSDDVFTSYK